MQMTPLMIALALMSAAPSVAAQTPPPTGALPRANTVTDRARPDYRYPQPWAGEAFTVVAVTNAECEPCARSLPFYKRVAAHPLVGQGRGAFVLVAKGGIWPLVEYIRNHPDGFAKPRVVGYPDDDRFAVRELPTLLVFGADGSRRGEWRGLLSADAEAEVLVLIGALSREVSK